MWSGRFSSMFAAIDNMEHISLSKYKAAYYTALQLVNYTYSIRSSGASLLNLFRSLLSHGKRWRLYAPMCNPPLHGLKYPLIIIIITNQNILHSMKYERIITT